MSCRSNVKGPAVDDPQWSYLTATEKTTVPRRHIFLGVDGQERRERGVFTQGWGAGVAIFRHAPKSRGAKEHRRGYTTPEALWSDVDAWCKARNRTVLWAWDLSRALRLADAFHVLPRRGWDVASWSIAPQGTWLVWRNGDRTLTMVELAAFFPTDWPTMLTYFQKADDKLLDNVTDYPPLLRSAHDAASVTRNAVVAYLDWIEREDLGDWQLTGTGQGFAAFRHRFLTHKMLIHWDEDARKAERRAMWAGRTEAYWHGTKRRAVIQEWDLTQAYPKICEHDQVPTELLRTLPAGTDLSRWLDDPDYAVLAEVTVSTELPCVPTESQGRILWPVGTFHTVLWDPELRLLRDHQATFDVSRAWLYRTTPALQDWARWITDHLRSDDQSAPAWTHPIAKHWSRAVIGRFGMQHAEWDFVGKMPRTAIKWWTEKDIDTGRTGELVHVGRMLWESTRTVDWSLSIPAIPSWVASRCREMMTRILFALGDGVALYADTDSLLIEAKHGHRLAAIAAEHPEWGLRLKRAWNRITILGPRQLITGDRIRVSGVPVRAALLADGSIAGEIRESLRTAIATGRVDRVRTIPRRWRLQGVDRRRTVGVSGWTEPVRLA